MLLEFATRYLGWLKRVPYLPLVWDQIVKIETALMHPGVLDLVDEVERRVMEWPEVILTHHRFGGLEFQLHNREFGHLHSNGLLDIYFGHQLRSELQAGGVVEAHHVHPNSGWTSFRLRCPSDVAIALSLLRRSYVRSSGHDPALDLPS